MPLRQVTPATRALELDTAIFYPTARSPISGDDQMRKYKVHKWTDYAALRHSDEWRQYLLDRQAALRILCANRQDPNGRGVSCANALVAPAERGGVLGAC